MGVCLGLMFDKDFPEADAFGRFTDGKLLVRALPQLDGLCQKEGVTPISTFAPDDEELFADLEAGAEPGELWFDTTDGVRTLSHLVRATKAGRTWRKEFSPSDARVVVECLAELERLLKLGRRKKARFALLYY